MTPREPDRYDTQAEQVAETWTAGHVALVDVVAAALRAAEADALERYDDALIDFMDKMRGNSTLSPSVKDACYLQFRAFRDHIRALASPAAAPAAETKVCVCRYLDGAEFMGKCPAHPAPPSEPAAPAADLRAWRLVGPFRISAPAQGAEAPDLRRVVERAQVELDRRDARIAELEAALRELTRAATEHANAHGCSGDLGARLSDAKAFLAARTSPPGAGEGT